MLAVMALELPEDVVRETSTRPMLLGSIAYFARSEDTATCKNIRVRHEKK
jgi:hypothetical protein